MASRAAAAIVGGYAFTWLFTTALALLLRQAGSMAHADAVLAATTLSFVVYAGTAIAVFCARSATRAWIGMLIAGVPPAVVLVLA